MNHVLAITHDLPDPARLTPVVVGSTPVVVVGGDVCRVDLRVWFRYPLVDHAYCVFQVEQLAPDDPDAPEDPDAPTPEWTPILGGTAYDRSIGGVLRKLGAVPYYGQAVERLACPGGSAFRLTIFDATPGWLYLAEVRG